MKIPSLKIKYTIVALLLFITFNCKNKTKNTDLAFTLIDRDSYFIDSYNSIGIYRLNSTRKPMDGYYVVGNTTQKWEEFNVKEGVLNGDYILFHNTGEIYTHSKYLNGKLHGEENKYYLSGELQKTANYNHGTLYGQITSYFESGQIQSESKIENEKTIESIRYNIIGGIESQMFIEDGKSITQNIKDGKVFSEEISSNYDDFEAVKFYNDDGSLKVFLQMLHERDDFYLIERNKEGKEIKRINAKKNPQAVLEYQQYLGGF